MTDEVPEAAAPASTQEAGAGMLGPDNLDSLEAVMRRMKPSQQPEAEEEPEEEEAEEQVPKVEPEEGEPSAEQADEDDDSLGGELEDLDDEESQWVRENPQSRLAKRIGKLIKRAKTAEEQLEALESQQQQADHAEEDPFSSATAPEDNPFKEIDTVEALAEKYREHEKFINWAEDLLDDHEDDLGDDVIHSEDGKDYTKRDVRKILRTARKEKEHHLPARLREIKDSEQRKRLDDALSEAAKTELQWMQDEESEKSRQFSRIINDERAKDIMSGPLAGQFRYMVAHALNSPTFMSWGKQTEQKPAPKPVYLKPRKQAPPSSPMSNAAAPSRGKSNTAKELARLQEAYNSTGSVDAAVALRTFKNTNNL